MSIMNNFFKQDSSQSSRSQLIIIVTLILCFMMLVSPNLKIVQQLPSQNNHIQPPSTQNIYLSPSQPFKHKELTINSIEWNLNHTYQSQSKSQPCTMIPPSLSLQTLFQIPQNTDNLIKTQYLYSEKYNKIYAINQKNIIVYRYFAQRQSLLRLSDWSFQNQCAKSGIIDNTQQYLYVFSCQGIIMIQVKTSLANIQYVSKFQTAFYGNKLISVNELIIWSSTYEGFKVYAKTISYNLTLKQEITTFRDQRMYISDIAYNQKSSLLFVLNIKQMIYVFQRGSPSSQHALIEKDIIQFPQTEGNFILKVHNHNIYVCSNYKSQSTVTQLQYYRGQVDLIRYYKGYQFVMDMDIIDSQLMVVESQKIDLYPTNIDPRKINFLMNGVTNDHLKDIIGFKRLSGNSYIAVSFNKISIIKLIVQKPQIQCKFEQEGNYKIKIKVPCEDELIKKQFFFDNCQKDQILNIDVGNKRSKVHIFWFVCISIVVFLVMILVLMFWRKGKMKVIDQLVSEIRKIKLKHQQRVQFVEDSQPAVKYNDWNNYMDVDIEGNNKDVNSKNDKSVQIQKQQEYYKSKSINKSCKRNDNHNENND